MFALIETGKSAGWRKRYSLSFEMERLIGMPCIRMRLNVPRRVRSAPFSALAVKAADKLAEFRVKEICFRDDFIYRERFCGPDFSELDDSALRAAKAGEIIARIPGNKDTILYFAGKFGASERKCLHDICGAFRYVAADVPPYLRKAVRTAAGRYGVSVIFSQSGAPKAGAAVFFDTPEREIFLPDDCTAFFTMSAPPENVKYYRYVDNIGFSFPETLLSEIPEGYPVDRLFSRAVGEGVVPAEKIHISDISTAFA